MPSEASRPRGPRHGRARGDWWRELLWPGTVAAVTVPQALRQWHRERTPRRDARPRPADRHWRDTEGIPDRCRIEQVAVHKEHGVLPSRLRTQGQVPGPDGPLVGRRVSDGWVDVIHIEGFSHDCSAW